MNRKTDIPVESEVKFYLSDKTSFEDRLCRIGARLLHERVQEINYRFDTPQMTLSTEHRVLRLRQDGAIRITYKGPSSLQEGVTVRDEIEFEVSDFTSARQLLEALGYIESVRYEKWRTTYLFDDLEITLDEMPFGNFTEMEGNDPGQIQRTAIKLALDWSTRINSSYMMLFDQVRRNKNMTIANLTFEDFRNVSVTADELGVKAADKP
jgi:adenylate cyclase, class 2